MRATHRCKVCNSKWTKNEDGSWSLAQGAFYSGYARGSAGKCCDNVAMGEQIEPWTQPPGPPDPPPAPPGRRVA